MVIMMTEKHNWIADDLCLIEETTGVRLFGTVCTDISFIAKQLNIANKTIRELEGENEQSKMMIATLRNMVLEQEDLEKENRKLDNRLNKYIVDYNGLNCEWHWLKTENEQIKKDLKIMLPLILAIDSKISIKECKAVNMLCKLVEDDFIKSKEINNLFKKKEYPKRNPITYAAVPEAIYNWDD